MEGRTWLVDDKVDVVADAEAEGSKQNGGIVSRAPREKLKSKSMSSWANGGSDDELENRYTELSEELPCSIGRALSEIDSAVTVSFGGRESFPPFTSCDLCPLTRDSSCCCFCRFLCPKHHQPSSPARWGMGHTVAALSEDVQHSLALQGVFGRNIDRFSLLLATD